MMGTFRVRVRVFNWSARERARDLEVIVGTGASRSVVPKEIAEELGIRPEKRRTFKTADGRGMPRDLGWTGVEYGGDAVHTLAVLGEPGDAAILGALTLEELALQVDPVRRVLLPAEQFLFAAA